MKSHEDLRSLEKELEREKIKTGGSPLSSSTSEASDDAQMDVRLVAVDIQSMRLAGSDFKYHDRLTFTLPDVLRLKTEVSSN